MRTLGRAAALALLAVSSAAFADVSVKQEAEAGPVGVGEPFRLTVSVSGAEREVSVQLPPGDYRVLGKSHGTSVEMTSGPSGMQTRRTEQFIFTLEAEKPGQLTIPGAKVTADGTALTSDPVDVEVQRGHVARAHQDDEDDADPLASVMKQMGGAGFSAPLMHRFFGSDPFRSDPFARDPFADAPIQVWPGDVRLEVVADRKTAHPNEQITISYYLVTRVPVSSVDGLELPAVSGAATRNIELGKQLVPEVSDGVARVLVARRALFANGPGPLQIAGATGKVEVGEQATGQEIRIASEPLTISIQPMPPGPPNAMVGRWSLSLTGPTHARAGEPLTIRVSAQGLGDSSSLPAPALSFPSGWKTFPPSTVESSSVVDGRVAGARTWDFVAIPSGEGPVSIGPVALDELDPESGRYLKVRSQSLALQIEAAAPVPAETDAAPARPAAIRPGTTSIWQNPALPISIDAALILLILAAAFVFFRRRSEREEPSTPRGARLRAARRELKEAHSLCSSEHAPAFFEKLSSALQELVAAITGQAAPMQDPAAIVSSLRSSGVSTPACETIGRALEACQRFAFLRTADGSLLRRTLALADEAFAAAT